MSSLTADPTEISNPAQRPITIILFGTNRNLTRTELKKTFAVKKGKLYKARNRHDIEIDVFDMLFAVRASRPADGLFFNYESKNSVSHIYVVDQGSCIQDFAILKYGAELLGGFDVVKSEMEDVQKVLEAYRAVASFCIRGKNSLNSLHQQTEMITDSHHITSSKFKKLLSKSVQELEDMTYPIISLAKDKVDAWYEMHFWKDVYSSSEVVSDKSV
ncbi:MAG: hypothetical protein B7Y59_07125 [Burkholderiales bacterium 35-55-47]|jgi:hypothetical protein|uniref:hypothetical protein n=1 Tax=Limnohabitans sp. TaxID=1907725 RepID=UPI000BDCBC93|nr:hypothetical protein [Limnohabitans sp.]OYY18859.1 MAG: hypothetical protein B7Y59_07125 [Burkholderiales bacterium 35-55-47]OYZ73678.1 MAG: hypothetical protein B7Y06_06555 [Burkholderiales bacterium 24-55-52]OZB00823.1 MAG: hypothetical protein B7X62_06570 [Burkholderiales bacterium 39-55-53]HQR85409.1 hypothetical protein [Limnohabitans sp.]HQS26674.1 hypothetical protein [Limnohabitans sp.]